jgi:hypothetical protein
MSENGEASGRLELFEDRVDSMLIEMVSYIRQFLQEEVNKYNAKLPEGENPKCVLCELDDHLEEISIKLIGNTHAGNEAHDIYHEMLNNKYGLEEDKDGI